MLKQNEYDNEREQRRLKKGLDLFSENDREFIISFIIAVFIASIITIVCYDY